MSSEWLLPHKCKRRPKAVPGLIPRKAWCARLPHPLLTALDRKLAAPSKTSRESTCHTHLPPSPSARLATCPCARSCRSTTDPPTGPQCHAPESADLTP